MTSDDATGEDINDTTGEDINDATGEDINDTTGEDINDATGEDINDTTAGDINDTTAGDINDTTAGDINDTTAGDIDDAHSLNPDAACEHLLDTYSDLLETTLDCADAVAAGFETTVDGHPATEDAQAIRGSLPAALERAGALERYPGMLADAVEAAGGSMAAPPVAGPPYVAITSTGPVLRATQGERRLVVRIETFEVRNSAFVRTATESERVLRVCLKG